jgi:hypothetical protein
MPGVAGEDGRQLGGQAAGGRESGLWFDSDHDGIQFLEVNDLMTTPGVMALGAQPDVGGMGGGIGGGGGVGGAGLDGEAAAAQGWTQAGGLSLLIDVPTAGQKLVFSKAGGDAKLALAVRPQESLSLGLGALWSLVWLVVAVVLLRSLQSAERRERLLEGLPLALCVVAGIVVLATTGLVQTAAWLAFAVTAGWLAWRNCTVEVRG